MKKHIILIVNIALIAVIVFGVLYSMLMSSRMTAPKQENKPTSASVVATEAPKPTEKYTVGILQHSDIPNCNAVYQGFITQLSDKGYTDGYNLIIDYALEATEDGCKKAVTRFIDGKYDLIFSIGPYAAKLAASMTEDIPIVFGAVYDPEEEGLVNSNETPKGNVTGVSSYIPCFEQIDSIKLLLPDAKKIGALYSATDASSLLQVIIAEKEADTTEVNLDCERYDIVSAEEIPDALEAMKKDGVDVIYTPVDNLITKNIDTVIKFSEKNKIPIICGNEEMFDKGCFSTSVINYNSIGMKSADMMLDIVQGKATPESMPVVYKYECYLYINKSSADALGITVSDTVLASAVVK